MGNQLTQPSRLAAAEAVAELGNVTFKDALGASPPRQPRPRAPQASRKRRKRTGYDCRRRTLL